jgi:2-polyprenyl-6-methoxyphenol hydroxylase-like FAD-dependent oxidoreductase
MKIIVVGAGIAGLTFALACHANGMQVKIVDKAKALRGIGGGIFLWPHGYRYLQELGLHKKIESVCVTAKYSNFYGNSGNLLLRDSHDEIHSLLNSGIFPLDRSYLQQSLIEQLPEGVLELNKSIISIENKADRVRVFFTDGTDETADLIVGADGVHSVVRKHIFPAREEVYSGYCWWGGMVDRKHVPHFARDEVRFTVGQAKVFSVWPVHGERFMWYLPAKLALDQFTPDRGQEQVEALCADWPQDMLQIVSAPQSAERFNVPVYEVAPSEIISHGRVALIGDAACTFGPLLGNGVNKAIEDAFVLAKLLQQTGVSLSARLQRYQQLRFPRHQRFFELERMCADSVMQVSSEAVQQFEAALPYAKVVMMYQDVIPLVNTEACAKIIADVAMIKNMSEQSLGEILTA